MRVTLRGNGNNVGIVIFQFVDPAIKMITASRDVNKFNRAVKAIDECDTLLEDKFPVLAACLESFKALLDEDSPPQMKHVLAMCERERNQVEQWLAEFAYKEFGETVPHMDSLVQSDGLAPLLKTVTEADLNDDASHTQIMNLTNSQSARNFYKEHRRLKTLMATCDTAYFKAGTGHATPELLQHIGKHLMDAKERMSDYQKVVSTLTVAQACFRGLRQGETRLVLASRALAAVGSDEIPANLTMMLKKLAGA